MPRAAQFSRPLLALTLALASSAVAHAAVTSVVLERRNSFNQEPNGSGYFISTDFNVVVQTAASADYDQITLAGPPPADVAQPLTKNGASYRLALNAGSDPDEALVNFPLGNYIVATSGGTLGAGSLTIADTAAPFTAAPFFGNFGEYENRLAGQEVTIQVPGFTPRAGATANRAIYSLVSYDAANNPTVVAQQIHDGNAPFTFGIPAGVTTADQFYTFGVEFQSDIEIPNAGLGGANLIIRSVGASGSSFRIQIPEPSGLGLAAGLFSAVAARRRRRR